MVACLAEVAGTGIAPASVWLLSRTGSAGWLKESKVPGSSYGHLGVPERVF